MDFTTHGGSANLIESDTDLVYDYNGDPDDDFQVFCNEQAPDFVVPQSNGNLVGAPVAGLTHSQTCSNYDIAIAGAVAIGATTRQKIDGLVKPL
jgi:hypothetical protein